MIITDKLSVCEVQNNFSGSKGQTAKFKFANAKIAPKTRLFEGEHSDVQMFARTANRFSLISAHVNLSFELAMQLKNNGRSFGPNLTSEFPWSRTQAETLGLKFHIACRRSVCSL